MGGGGVGGGDGGGGKAAGGGAKDTKLRILLDGDCTVSYRHTSHVDKITVGMIGSVCVYGEDVVLQHIDATRKVVAAGDDNSGDVAITSEEQKQQKKGSYPVDPVSMPSKAPGNSSARLLAGVEEIIISANTSLTVCEIDVSLIQQHFASIIPCLRREQMLRQRWRRKRLHRLLASDRIIGKEGEPVDSSRDTVGGGEGRTTTENGGVVARRGMGTKAYNSSSSSSSSSRRREPRAPSERKRRPVRKAKHRGKQWNLPTAPIAQNKLPSSSETVRTLIALTEPKTFDDKLKELERAVQVRKPLPPSRDAMHLLSKEDRKLRFAKAQRHSVFHGRRALLRKGMHLNLTPSATQNNPASMYNSM